MQKLKELLINKGLGVFIICLAIAVFLRIYLTTEPLATKTVITNLEFLNIPAQTKIKNRQKTEIIFHITASKKFLPLFNSKSIQAFINLKNSKIGKNTIAVQYRINKVNQKNIKKITIKPSKVTIILEKIIEKTVPIKLSASGSPRSGYKWDWRITPSEVKLRGPRSSFKNLKFIYTEKINLKGKRHSFNTEIKLNIPPGLEMNSDVEEFKLHIYIQEVANEIRLLGIPLQIKNLHKRLKIGNGSIPTLDIKIRGAQNAIADLKRSDIQAVVDLSHIQNKTKIIVKPVIIKPARLKVLEIDPAKIPLTIERKGMFE